MTFKEWVQSLPGDSERNKREWLANKISASLSTVNSWFYGQRTPSSAMIRRLRDLSGEQVTFETFHPKEEKGGE